jgi:hypothetical protein
MGAHRLLPARFPDACFPSDRAPRARQAAALLRENGYGDVASMRDARLVELRATGLHTDDCKRLLRSLSADTVRPRPRCLSTHRVFHNTSDSYGFFVGCAGR